MRLPGDYAWKDLSEETLANQVLDNSDFTGAVLRRVDFWGTSLKGCQFQFADLEDADLGLAQLAGAEFTGAWLGGATVAAANDLYAPGAFYGGREHWEPLRDVMADLLQGRCSDAEAAQRALGFTAADPMEIVGEVLYDRGERDHARMVLRAAFDLEGSVNAARMLARVLAPPEAIAVLQQVDNSDVGVAGDLGYLLLRTGRVQEARPLLFAALEGDTLDPAPYYAAAAFDLSEGRVHEARKLLELAVERGSDVPEYRLALAALLLKMGEPGPAAEHLSVITRARHADLETWVGAAELLHRTGRPELALDLTQRADPGLLSAALAHRRRRLRIEALCCLGEVEQAQAELGGADDPWLRSRVLWAGGQGDEARRVARETAPSLDLVDWLADMGDDQGALAMLDQMGTDAQTGPGQAERLVALVRRVDPQRLGQVLGALWQRPGGAALAGLAHRAQQRWGGGAAAATLGRAAAEAGPLLEMLPSGVRVTAPPAPLFPDGFSVCGTDEGGPVLALWSKFSVATGTPGWTRVPAPGATRLWRPVGGCVLEPLRDPDAADLLYAAVHAASARGPHPFVAAGIGPTLHALMPQGAHPALRERIAGLVAALSTHYGLTDEGLKAAPRGLVVDGFGPEQLLRVDGEPAVLPELPPVLEGPARWNAAQWCAATCTDWQTFYTEDKLRIRCAADPDDALFQGMVILALVYAQFSLLGFVVPLPELRIWRLMDQIQRRTVIFGG